MCKNVEKSIDHFLIHLRVPQNSWFSLFGILWVVQSSVKDLSMGYDESFVGKKGERLRKQLLFAHSRQFGCVIEEPLKECNIQINLLRIPLFVTYK